MAISPSGVGKSSMCMVLLPDPRSIVTELEAPTDTTPGSASIRRISS